MEDIGKFESELSEMFFSSPLQSAKNIELQERGLRKTKIACTIGRHTCNKVPPFFLKFTHRKRLEPCSRKEWTSLESA